MNKESAASSGSTFNTYLTQQLENPALREEYEALEPEFSIIQAMIDTCNTVRKLESCMQGGRIPRYARNDTCAGVCHCEEADEGG